MIGMQELKGISADLVQAKNIPKISNARQDGGPAVKADKINNADSTVKDQPSRGEFEEIILIAQRVIFGTDTHYEFRLHEKTGTMMCKLVDNETDETVREIPPEKILDMVAGIWELVGIIVDEKA